MDVEGHIFEMEIAARNTRGPESLGTNDRVSSEYVKARNMLIGLSMEAAVLLGGISWVTKEYGVGGGFIATCIGSG